MPESDFSSTRSSATHRIAIDAPVAQCQRFFTPAGEALWVEGWQPRYLWPADGRTEPSMVFTTGSGDDFTLWTLVDFDTEAHHARYARVTPALRSGVVQVRCMAEGPRRTLVDVSYTLTALTEAGARSLAGFEGAAFVAMIEGWKQAIDACLPALLATRIA